MNYKNRLERLGPPEIDPQVFRMEHEVTSSIPVLDEKKKVVGQKNQTVVVPASETLGRYKAIDFDLTDQMDAGVDLRLVNVDAPNSAMIDQIDGVVDALSGVQFNPDSSKTEPFETEPPKTEPSNLE